MIYLRWITQKSSNINMRFGLFTDSQNVKSALNNKGRIRKPTLNRLCRNVSDVLPAARIKVDLFYIQSVENPADWPSRFILASAD